MSNFESDVKQRELAQRASSLIRNLYDMLSKSNYTPAEFVFAIPLIVGELTIDMTDEEFNAFVDGLRDDIIRARKAWRNVGGRQ